MCWLLRTHLDVSLNQDVICVPVNVLVGLCVFYEYAVHIHISVSTQHVAWDLSMENLRKIPPPRAVWPERGTRKSREGLDRVPVMGRAHPAAIHSYTIPTA